MSLPKRQNSDGSGPPAKSVSVPTTHSGSLDSSSLVTVGLIILVLAVFACALDADFVNYDDPDYVLKNSHVYTGLDLGNVVWAFQSTHASNWHPLTWLSHMVDCELFGFEPSGHHAVSVLLHAANSALLFWVLRRMTGEVWPSAAVAALWAVHPLRVESVAWVSERKDVLSGVFFLLTIAAYTTYVRRPSILRYGLVLLLFALGLMAKPMLVTTPFVLLLLDYWPLNRIGPSCPKRILRNMLLEKLPLIALSVISSVITISAQTGAMEWATESNLTFGQRIANALVSYAVYLTQLFYPFNLAIPYPHPVGNVPTWQIAGAAILLAMITTCASYRIRSAPYLAVGWFWYLGMLVPVIGLVQVGYQAHADRYTYLPLIGLTWSIVWAGKSIGSVRIRVAIGIGVFAALMAISWRQVSYWRDSELLFMHAIDCTGPNSPAQNNLGKEYERQGLFEKAAEHYRHAIQIDPGMELARVNLAVFLVKLGQFDEAIAQMQKLVDVRPNLTAGEKKDWAMLHQAVAIRLLKQQQFPEAIDYFQRALTITPDSKDIQQKLAMAYLEYGAAQRDAGQPTDAITHFRRAIEADPELAAAHNSLGASLSELKMYEEAAACFRRALELEPGNPLTQKNLQEILLKVRP